MILTILMILFLILVGVASLVLVPFSYLLRLFDKSACDHFSFGFARGCLAVLAWLSRADITYKGLEYLPEDGDAVVFMGNHRSFFDIILFYPKLKGITGFAVKKEMQSWPVVGWWLKLVHCIFIDRTNQRQGLASILAGINYIKSGVSMMIFPEGTRSPEEGVLLNFKRGAFKLATKSKVRIVPVAYNNTSEIFENHLPVIKKTKVCIEVCEPIDTSKLSEEEIQALPETVREIITETVRKNASITGTQRN